MITQIPDTEFTFTDEDFAPDYFTDEQVLRFDTMPWIPEGDLFYDIPSTEPIKYEHLEIPPLLHSDFTSFAFYMMAKDGLSYENFSFEGRRHMLDIYNSNAPHLFLFTARQVEKSTFIGNTLIGRSCTTPGHRSLYVSPSATQTKTFSRDRIADPLNVSPVLKKFTSSMLSQNLLEKQFLNRSVITLRYAFLNADRCRGISTWLIALDELQSILTDLIPIIEQSSSHAPQNFRRSLYAGTPLSLDNTMEYYRSGIAKDGRPMSTQSEWVVPCDRCGSKSGAGRYWNILGEANLGKKFLICAKCGQQLFPMHPDARWAHQTRDGIFESYRIPQLMVPWRKWSDIMLDYTRYSRAQFYNEVLGLSSDAGTRPLTTDDVQRNCNPQLTMHPTALAAIRRDIHNKVIFAGIDWGGGSHSYTVMTLGYYEGSRFRIFWIHRFTGEDEDPDVQMKKIIAICKAFHVKIIGADWGGGLVQNNNLVRKFGRHRVQRFHYQARMKKKLHFEPLLQRFMVHRTEVMSDIFNAIKRGCLEFPRWEEFHDPFAKDMLNIHTEYNEKLRMIQYDHRLDCPDDSFHSILYCFLVSMIIYPRADVISPQKVADNTTAEHSIGGMVFNQG